jgi:hypothetical protein
MPLTDRAENVLLRLKLEGIGTRPLVFITQPTAWASRSRRT